MATVGSMTSHVARLYVLIAGVLTFFIFWAAVAAHPWAPRPAQDTRLVALAARQQRVQVESIRVKRIVDARWTLYRHRLATHNAAAAQQVAAQPSVRVVNLPALVVTRTS